MRKLLHSGKKARINFFASKTKEKDSGKKICIQNQNNILRVRKKLRPQKEFCRKFCGKTSETSFAKRLERNNIQKNPRKNKKKVLK